MKVGEEITLQGSVWECILGGNNTAVIQKKKAIQRKPQFIPTINKKEDVYYLEFIHAEDIQHLLVYLKEEKIKHRKIDLYYVLLHYCNLRVVDIAESLNASKSFVSGSTAYVQNTGTLEKADELARSVGYWKYKQLNERK